jgi:hypothetical protein
MKRTLSLLVVLGLGCGGGGLKVKVNTAKVAQVKKIAVVGNCQATGVAIDIPATNVYEDPPWGPELLPFETAAFNETFAQSFKTAQVVTLEAAVAAGAPKGEKADPKIMVCAGELNPFKGKNPDVATMKAMAEKLDVDAVIAVFFRMSIKSSIKGAAAAASTGYQPLVFVVDRSGEMIAKGSGKGETARIEHLQVSPTNLGMGLGTFATPEQLKALGSMYGKLMAEQFAAALAGQKG